MARRYTICRALRNIEYAQQSLTVALAKTDNQLSDVWMDYAAQHLRMAAKAMGFDLVPRISDEEVDELAEPISEAA